jgi:GNAT superfamily N-acetyltransferase
MPYRVQRVPVERTRALRKRVLRPYLPPEDPYVLPDDHLPTTVCFGALTPEDRLIGVARITPEPPPFPSRESPSFRLRGMATSPEARNLGVGTAVLRAVIAHVAGSGGGLLWCNARVSALGLYERCGLARRGEIWEEPEIGPHVVMWRVIDPVTGSQAERLGCGDG